MAKPENEGRIDYIEFTALDIEATKEFYSKIFAWKFCDYGPDYTSFDDGRLAGGFCKGQRISPGGPLVVLYTADIASTLAKVKAAGGTITKEIFEFPGGCRFHFTDPSGNELAVWSE